MKNEDDEDGKKIKKTKTMSVTFLVYSQPPDIVFYSILSIDVNYLNEKRKPFLDYDLNNDDNSVMKGNR